MPAGHAAQVDEAVTLFEAQRIPSSAALLGEQTIPVRQDEWSAKADDGKGIDHFLSACGDRLVQIVVSVSAGA